MRGAYKNFNQFIYDASGNDSQEKPDEKKVSTILSYARPNPQCTTFIETGTYFGSTPLAVKDAFKNIVTIELDPWLYGKASARLEPFPNILCLHGDSGIMLPKILNVIHEPVFYWLDAHYSRGVTGLGLLHTPIIRELEAIRSHECFSDSVILIDDAGSFSEDDHYPDISELEQFVSPKKVSVVEGVIVVE